MTKKVNRLFRLMPFSGLFLMLLLSNMAQSQNCTLQIPASEGTIDGRGNASGVAPGDTICLMPGQKSYLWITHLHGTPAAPIVITNKIGMISITQFYYGIKVDSCSYIKLSGKGVSLFPYGINVHDVNGSGMSIEGLSTDIEVEGIEISNTIYAGIFCKSDPDCEFLSTRDKYTMRNVSFHDNYIHDTGMEGFYIGSSFYTGITLNCNGKDTTLYPHVIRGLKVYNNRLVRTGWDGIQASCADSSCVLYGNEILYDSDLAELNQMSGIIIGEGSVCDCYNNRIIDGKGNGIQVLGLGGNKVYNNLIVNPGRTYLQEYPYMNGFYVGDQETTPGSNFLIAYNTIISPRDFGIDFRNQTTSGNQFINNMLMNYGREVSQGTNISITNNHASPAFDPSQFVDPAIGNYDLKPSSAAVNNAMQVSQLDLKFDILNRTRPYDLINDIGAYECQLVAIPELTESSIQLIVESGLRTHVLIIRYVTTDHGNVKIGMYDLTGRLVEMVVDARLSPGEYVQQVDINALSGGIYIFRMTAGKEYISKKIQLCR